MMETKGTEAGKVGQNYPRGALIGDTSRARVGGVVPPTQALPTMADQQPWLTVGGQAQMPSSQETQTLPVFGQVAGNTDTGVGHSGDMGGAG